MRYFRTGFGKRKVKIINATLASDELSGLYTLTLENGKITGRERQDFYKKAADGEKKPAAKKPAAKKTAAKKTEENKDAE